MKEELTEQEQIDLKNALEHIGELEHLMKKHPVEMFKTLLKMKTPIVMEISIGGGIYSVNFNDPD